METQPHLLVVDDDREIRALVGEYLKKNGYRVSLAADGRQMATVLEESRIVSVHPLTPATARGPIPGADG